MMIMMMTTTIITFRILNTVLIPSRSDQNNLDGTGPYLDCVYVI